MERCTLVFLAIAIIVIIVLVFSLKSEGHNQEKDQEPRVWNHTPEPNVMGGQPRSRYNSHRSEDEVCLTADCVEVAAKLLKYMDQSVDPCDDFYEFACGNFLRNTIIPDDKLMVGPIEDIKDVVQRQLKTVLEQPSSDEELNAVKLAKKFYSLCIDELSFEDTSNVKELIKTLGGWPILEGTVWDENSFDWKESAYKLSKYGFNEYNFINIKTTLDVTSPTQTIISIEEPNLLFGRNLIIGVESLGFKDYHEYLIDLAEFLGAERKFSENEVEEMVYFQVLLANITSLGYGSTFKSFNFEQDMKIWQLQLKYPSINWLEYLNKFINLPNAKVTSTQKIHVTAPYYLSKIVNLLEGTSKRVLANHLMLEVLLSVSFYLPKLMRDYKHSFDKILFGYPEVSPRWDKCVTKTVELFETGTGVLYVRKYFTEEVKQTTEQMVLEIKNEFIEILGTITWMDRRTRQKAVEKAMAIKTYVGCADYYFDDKKINERCSELQISSKNILHFLGNATVFNNNQLYSKLNYSNGKRRDDFVFSPTRVNAVYHVTSNSIKISAAMLQGIAVRKDRLRLISYANIGFIIGHEISHGFTAIGGNFDGDGNFRSWWTIITFLGFKSKAKCVVEQYSNYTVAEIGKNVDGSLTQSENIADQGGMKEAYMAYNSWIQRNGPEPKLPGLNYTTKQLFWISAASNWCSKKIPLLTHITIIDDEHAPERYRVVGTLSNMDEFAADFQCPQGSKMNPKHKCRIW